MPPKVQRPKGDNHALLIGEVLGTLLKGGFHASPEVIDGDYTNRIFVQRPSGTWCVTVEPVEGQVHEP